MPNTEKHETVRNAENIQLVPIWAVFGSLNRVFSTKRDFYEHYWKTEYAALLTEFIKSFTGLACTQCHWSVNFFMCFSGSYIPNRWVTLIIFIKNVFLVQTKREDLWLSAIALIVRPYCTKKIFSLKYSDGMRFSFPNGVKHHLILPTKVRIEGFVSPWSLLFRSAFLGAA